MTASLRDLRERVSDVAVPPVDVSDIVSAGERRLRWRRAAMTGGSLAVVLALVAGGVALTNGADRSQAPVDKPTKEVTPTPDPERPASTRPLTYAAGSTIHYGQQVVDVAEQVHHVDVTDDGVVFVRGPSTWRQWRRTALWFTDGSTIQRIGTVEGASGAGFPVVAGPAGSIVVWREPAVDGRYVVFDTGDMHVLATIDPSDAGDVVLSVLEDAVYWGSYEPRALGCIEVVSFPPCVHDEATVVRYDLATGELERVSGVEYNRDRRSRPRTLVGRLFGEPKPVIYDRVVFIRHGRRMLVDGGEPGYEYNVKLARTGAPVRLRVPPGSTAANQLALAQWLDDDHVVLFGYRIGGSELADPGDFLTCVVSTGRCELAIRGERGTGYEVPTLD